MSFKARATLLTAMMGIFPLAALAQAPPPTAAPAPGDTAAPAPATSTSAAPVFPATGYGWSTTPAPRRPRHGHPRPARVVSQTPDAVLPGFETLADGSTRLFVQLSRPVQFVTKPAQGTLTFVLQGAHVDRRNNYNPLVTVHFNTPVSSARLVPHGNDLWFVVDLRANVSPQVTMDAAKDGGAMLRIEFPKGDYLPGGQATPSPSASSSQPPTSPAPSAAPPAAP
jgi:hypothetical protein